ncbi:hypothetical protein H6758_01900 [Candidatus Nomurabacteria bacterium]|nr:hypothetical protein [Candidatus Nomurabacteria bacterium]
MKSKFFTWTKRLIQLELVLSVLFLGIVIWLAGADTQGLHPFWQGYRAGFIEEGLNYDEAFVRAGEVSGPVFFALIACVLSLLALQKRQKNWYVVAMIVWALMIVSALGQGELPAILPLIIIFMMSSKKFRNQLYGTPQGNK